MKSRSKFLKVLKPSKVLVYLFIAGFVMVIFTYLTPPLLNEDLICRIPLLHALPGDLPIYSFRFLLSFTLLGIVPLLTALLSGENIKSLGFVRFKPFCSTGIIIIILLFMVIVGLIGAYNPKVFAYYPYSHTLIRIINERGFIYFFMHLLLYFILYYLPWELFFRGFLILPFIRLFDSGQYGISLLIIASFQAIPSALLHFGHPLIETLLTIPFSVILGYMVLKTGSILPGLFLHSIAGITLDLFIILRHLDIMP